MIYVSMATVNDLAEQLLKKGVASSRMDAMRMASQMMGIANQKPKTVNDIYDTVRQLQKQVGVQEEVIAQLQSQIGSLQSAQHTHAEQLSTHQDALHKAGIDTRAIRDELQTDLQTPSDQISESLSQESTYFRDELRQEESNDAIEQEIVSDLQHTVTHTHKDDEEALEAEEELDYKKEM